MYIDLYLYMHMYIYILAIVIKALQGQGAGLKRGVAPRSGSEIEIQSMLHTLSEMRDGKCEKASSERKTVWLVQLLPAFT